MTDPLDRIDELFASEIEPDSTGSLVRIAEAFPGLRLRLLAVAESGGEPLCADWVGEGQAPPVASLRREIEAALEPRAGPGEAAASEIAPCRFAVALERTGAPPVHLLGWSERRPGDSAAGSSPEEWKRLELAGRLAIGNVLRSREIEAIEGRVRHLRNENEMLSASHARNVAEMLDARELQVRQQREYVERLESEVEARSADLREALAQAEAASESKSAFLANMSHEIRTPMTAILGYVDLLVDPDLGRPELEEYARIIGENGRVLLRIVDDILDLSSIEAGILAIEAEEIGIEAIVEGVVRELEPAARKKGVKLDRRVDDDVPAALRLDAKRVRQLLFNLVDNAVKFTTAGSIAIDVTYRRSAEAEWLGLEVSDTGIGMTEDEIGALFQPFTQGDASSTRRFGGAGLGLAISRRIARLLDGDLTVRSSPGEGSTFRATLRVETEPQRSEPAVAARPAGPGGREGGGDEPIVSELSNEGDLEVVIREFLEEFPAIVVEMAGCLEQDDFDALAGLADRVRDEGSAVGFPALANESWGLLADCRRRDVGSARIRVERLRSLAVRLST